MFRSFTCPCGHHWSVAAATEGIGSSCPECGALGESTPAILSTLASPRHEGILPSLPRPAPQAALHVAGAFGAPHVRTEECDRPIVPGYEILQRLGRGGMGVVYKARQLALERIVALKMILAGPQADADELARFRTEAQAVARLQHPNIVQIHEVGEQDGRPYFSLEYVDGGSLAEKLAGQPQPPQEAARLVETLARAIHFAHQREILHRDLKPANILLVSGESVSGEWSGESVPGAKTTATTTHHSLLTTHQAKITDFGLAKKLDDACGQTQTGAIMGTPSYMAPEQAAGKTHAIGPPADIYALGAILYELLTGRPPFLGVSAMDTLRQVVHEEPVPPRRLQPRAPRDLEIICLKCLEKDPRKRYVSAADLAEDLRRFQANEPIQARPNSAWERCAKWMKRRPAAALAALLGPVAVLASVAAFVFLWFNADLQQAHRAEEKQRRRTETALGLAEDAKRQEEEHRKAAEKARDAAKLAQKAEADARKGETAQRQRAEDALAENRVFRYFNVIGHADRELLANNVARADELLDGEGCPPELRGWEWHYLKRLGHSERFSLAGPSGYIRALAFSPGNKLLAVSTSVDKTVRVWDLSLRRPIRGFKHPLAVDHLAFNSDGQRLTAVWADQAANTVAVRIWDVGLGKLMRTWNVPDAQAWGIALAPDGQLLAAGNGDKAIKLWDVQSGQELGSVAGPKYTFVSIGYQPDGKPLLSTAAPGGDFRIWNPLNGQAIASLGKSPPSRVLGSAFSADGQQFAWASGRGEVWRWSAAKGVELLHGRHALAVHGLAFSHVGDRLATASGDLTVKLWDTQTADELAVFRGHPGMVSRVAFSPDGRLLASGGEGGTVRVWDAPKQDLLRPGEDRAIARDAFSSDGKRLAIVTARTLAIRLFDVMTGKAIPTPRWFAPKVHTMALSADGRRLAVAQGAVGKSIEIKVLDVDNPQKSHVLTGHTDFVTSAVFSPDGKLLATASRDRTVRLWDPLTGASGKVLVTIGGAAPKKPEQLAFSPDSQRLAVAIGATVQLWDVSAGQLIGELQGQRDSVYCLAFSRDGQRLAAGRGRAIDLWDLADPGPPANLQGHSNVVHGLTYSADGKRLVSASSDQTVRIWDTKTGQPILALRGHRALVGSVAFGPDERQLFSVSRDGVVMTWDATPREGE